MTTASVGVMEAVLRVVICGSSHWAYDRVIEDKILKLRELSHSFGRELLVIHGGEPGAEAIAQAFCTRIGVDQVVYPAHRVMGDHGFRRRNQIMLQEHEVDLVVVFAHVLQECSAVRDILQRANRKGIKIDPVDFEAISAR